MANTYTAYTKLGNVNSLANGAYSSLIGTRIDLGANPPSEVFLHMIGLTPNTTATAGNTATVFVSASSDDTYYADAPTDANTALNSCAIGTTTFTANTTARSGKPAAISPFFGGAIPRYLRVYVLNSSGAAFSSGTGAGVNEIGWSAETFG